MKSISDLFGGRDRHWNQAYGPYIELVHYKASTFPPEVSPLFTKFTASAAAITNYAIGYDVDPSFKMLKIIHKNIKSITPEQFQTAHNLNIWTLIAIFAKIDPQSRDLLFSQGEKFIGIRDNDIRVVEGIMNLSQPDINQIAMIVYPELTHAFGYRDPGMILMKSAPLAHLLSTTITTLLPE